MRRGRRRICNENLALIQVEQQEKEIAEKKVRVRKKKALTLEQKQAQCRSIREVKSCSECLRYRDCFEPGYHENRMKEPLNKGEQRLLTAIIVDACNEFMESWRKGNKNALEHNRRFLIEDERAFRWTLEQFHGEALVEAMTKKCIKKYGEFEPIYQAKVKLCNQKIKELKALIKKLKKEFDEWLITHNLKGVVLKDYLASIVDEKERKRVKKAIANARKPLTNAKSSLNEWEKKLNA